MKINKLTEDRELKVLEYQKLYWDRAVCCEIGDHSIAEKAALELAEIAGLKNLKTHWVLTPQDAVSLRDSLNTFLSTSFSNSLSGSLSELLSVALDGFFSDALISSLRASLSTSLKASFSNSLIKPPSRLWDSLNESLWNSLGAPLRTSVGDSIWDSFRDSGWTAFYAFVVEELKIECSNEHKKILKCYSDISVNASAVWMLPGHVILLERPESVDIKDGKLLNVTWAGDSCKYRGTPIPSYITRRLTVSR